MNGGRLVMVYKTNLVLVSKILFFYLNRILTLKINLQ